MSKKLVIGILAHVDAGKTTLSEAFLYLCGQIRTLGRVDHQDAFLDHFALERARGITIFSKQAELVFRPEKEDHSQEEVSFTLLDTPGHTDFAAEMERTLQVLDYAVLVVSGADGVQGHTETLWKLLEQYRIPVFLFVNKMDQPGTDAQARMQELRSRLDDNCVCFSGQEDRDAFLESVALCDESVMERYLETGEVADADIVRLISERKLFPCYFGSALKLEGVRELLEGLASYSEAPVYGDRFGARVYKISRDEQGGRLTHMKITGGVLRVRDLIAGGKDAAGGAWEEKVSQIRIVSGDKYETVQEVAAGNVCAVTGLTKTWAGEGLGAQQDGMGPVLAPVLTYRMLLPDGCDVHKMIRSLRMLEEEEPQLHIDWNEELQEIHVQVMGEVQTEILHQLILDRFHTEVSFGEGNIVYRETIAAPVRGAGHFEPLRHYAEVHLLLEPGERGSGICVESECSTDVLDLNWQRLILTHILETEHPGVLIGAPVTDLRITLIAGRAHLKHTEGGDFRQATYRAIRQGLMKAESILLEPWYRFRMTVPSDAVGRAMADIQRMGGSSEPPDTEGDFMVLSGTVPVAGMRGYQAELNAYTHGRGALSCLPDGYRPCHNAQEVIDAAGYDPERDAARPCGSVFCSHGAGFYVPWYEADAYMHIQTEENRPASGEIYMGVPSRGIDFKDRFHDEDELKAIFERTYGTSSKDTRNIWKRRKGSLHESGQGRRRTSSDQVYDSRKAEEKKLPEYLLVDGYNIIFAWDELSELAERDIGGARTRLMDLMCNYQGFSGCELILVFDAYRVEGHPGEIFDFHNIHVVYTKEAETADQYIEKTVRKIRPQYKVTVATSDRLEQVIILGEGAHRLSASDFYKEVEYANEQIRRIIKERRQRSGKIYLFDGLDEELAGYMEDLRLGKKEIEKDDTDVRRGDS